MQYFKTDWSLPPVVQTAPRTRTYRRSIRYGHARLGSPVKDTAAPAPVLIALPRVQAVVDAVIELRNEQLEAA